MRRQPSCRSPHRHRWSGYSRWRRPCRRRSAWGDLLRKRNERTSLTKADRDCDPSPDKRTTRIVDFRQDEHGDWVAVLSCGHTQHVRHRPPWQNRAWVLDPERRQARLGSPFACGWCARDRSRDEFKEA
ncbi:DUF3565 domain-containing protein [Ectopseudomonas hydrolytica]|uniref:DUF3565 domain-containing protein n=1 Tax=Ectopseudomonas hydrolytica TaxID=2493633 RepID=UPI003C2FBCB4